MLTSRIQSAKILEIGDYELLAVIGKSNRMLAFQGRGAQTESASRVKAVKDTREPEGRNRKK